MGAGKSTVGRRLAERLGRSFVDTDELVEREARSPVERIIREAGEGAFRELEERALLALGDARGLVVATGGGLFLGARQRRRMKRLGTVVWLDVRPEVAAARVGAADGRPLWNLDDPVDFRLGFDRRRAVYALADVRVDAEGEPDVVVEATAAAVRRVESGRGSA